MNSLSRFLIIWLGATLLPTLLPAQLSSLPIEAIRKGMRVQMICIYQNENDPSQADTLRVANETPGTFYYFSGGANIFPLSPGPHFLSWATPGSEAAAAGSILHIHEGDTVPAFVKQDEGQCWEYPAAVKGVREVCATETEITDPVRHPDAWFFTVNEKGHHWQLSYLPGCGFTRIVMDGVAWNLVKVNRWEFDLTQPPYLLRNLSPEPQIKAPEPEEESGE